MTNQDTSIETLQTQVRQVTIDIDAVKSETSDTLKKLKAEAAVNKIKSTKEEITKKLEVLNKLTDANAKADVAKLEAMLVTLESFSELNALKISVVSPIEMPKNNETIDNTADIGNITTGMEIMKTMIMELQSSIDGYIAQKATMSEIDKTNKEKEIEEKKIAIEVKRKEIQTSIDKIKKVRSEFKLEDITDETLKAAMKTQKETEEKNIADQQKQLNALVNPATTFFEKVKNGVSKTWEKVKEWASKTRERAKENPKTAIAATAWIGLLIRWISKLFKKRKKNKEKDEGGEKKEKKSRWKKALLWAGIWTWWILIWKNWDTIKDWFSGLFGKETPPAWPNLPNSFEWLTPEQKEKYENTSDEIDIFTKENIDLSTVVEFAEDDKVNKANIIFWLDKNSKNLQNFYTNDTLDYISWETTDGPIDNIMNRWKDKMWDILGPFLLGLESFKPLWAEFIAKPAETLDKWLQWGKPEERRRILSLFYREYMNIINYSVEKKKLLEEKLAKEEIMTKARINETPTEKEEEAIQDLLDSNERRKWKLDSFFKKYQLMDLSSLCKNYGIEIKEVSWETKELLQDLQEEKDEILQKNDDGETVFSRAETDFADWWLQEDTKSSIDGTCEKLLDIEFWDNSKSLFTAYTHLITDIFGDNKELADSFMEKTKIKEVSEEFKAKLEWYRAKLKAWSFEPKDLQDLKIQTDTYLSAKKHYELSMKNIDYMSDWSTINVWKILSLPLDAAKDIAKARKWETNSRRERIWYGLWWCYIVWQTLYLGSTLIAGKTLVWKWLKLITYWVGKTGIEIGKLPITLTEKWLKLLTGRTHLTSWWWSRYIKNAEHLNKLEKADLLKYAFLNGEISESWVVNVAKKLEIPSSTWGTIHNVDEILVKRWLQDPKQIELFKKHRNNKSLRNLLVKKSPIENLKITDKLKYSIRDKALKVKVEFNPTNLTKLQTIEENIQTLTSTWSKERVFRETFMKNTKTLDKIDDLMKNKKLMWLLTEIWNTSDDYVRLSKILANNFHSFSSLDELEKYMVFLKNNKSSITSTNTFIRNSIWKRGKIKAMNPVDQAKYIETAKLNTSFLDRRINWMKENFKKSAETLKKLMKRSPYPEQVAETARNLENMANTENEVYRSAQMAKEVGEWAWLSGKTWLMNQISPLLKEKAFLEALSKAKTPQAIKELFATKWINSIPEELAQSLAKTKSTKKILDTVEYVANYDKLNGLMKILKNPSMRYAWRVAGRVLWVWTVVLGGVFAYQTYQEWTEIMKTNKDRWEIKQQESFYDLWLALAWACAFVPWIGWIASWAIILGTTIWGIAKETIFDTLDKYNKNYKDFLQDSPLLIKQHILTTILWQNKTDAAMWEYLARRFSSKDFKHLTNKTWSEAMTALLYIEEWKNNPLAMFDITKAEDKTYLANLNPPKTAEDVGKAIDEVDARVNKRSEYLKQKLWTQKWKNSMVLRLPIPGSLLSMPKKVEYEENKEYLDIQKVLTKDVVSKWKWIEVIDQLLLQSSYALDNPDVFDSPEKNESQKKQLKEKLDSDPSLLTKLEGLYAKDPKSLLYMYRYTNDYNNHINTFWTNDDKYGEIINHMEYFTDYMNYKSLETWLDIPKHSQWFTEPDFILCRKFFLDCDFKESLTSKEIYWETPKIQNILYRIATEIIGAKINDNSLEELQKVFTEANEKSYGIYFDDWDAKRLSVNWNYFTDTEYDSSDDATIQKIKQDIQEKIKTNDLIDIGTWDKILNKEIWSKYIKILDEELARK